MAQNYKEQDFEEHIVKHLTNSGYDQFQPTDFDKDLCLIKEDVIASILATQTNEYEKLQRQYAEDTQNKLLYRLSQEISKKGTLHVLRKGIKDRGCKFCFAYFKPSSKMNPEHQILYGRNRFSVIRQLKYSKRNKNSIDIVIFLNGIPVITAELKNSLTGQFVQNAIKQYKQDRDPREPLLQYKRCLVHFAVGNEEVFMTTKLQTGFDEPLLHTMYVDKKLGGVQAVQALSRLNRTANGKTDTLILDFVNDTEDILTSFQPYYQNTFLEEETEPNKLYDLQSQLESYEVFTENDVKEFAEIFFNPKEKPEMMQPILDRVVATFKYKEEQEREDFRGTLQSFIRLYGFISGLVTFIDVELEKLYIFCKNLNRKLPKRENRLPYEVRDAVDLDSFRIQKTYEGSILLNKKNGELKGISNGTAKPIEEEKDYLSNIIKSLNEMFGTNLTNEDNVDLGGMNNKLREHDELRTVMENKNNTIYNWF